MDSACTLRCAPAVCLGRGGVVGCHKYVQRERLGDYDRLAMVRLASNMCSSCPNSSKQKCKLL